MINASGEHHPERILKYAAAVLVFALLAYAAFLDLAVLAGSQI